MATVAKRTLPHRY